MFSLFKKKQEIRNCHHEDFAHLVEPAFVGHGVHSDKTKYYRFKGNTELDMIAGRYNKGIKFLSELSMRISSEDLMFYIEKIEGSLSGTSINLVELAKWVSLIKDRTKLLMESETALKMASVSYFDEHEVLDSYDFAYGQKKIKAWKDGGDYSFFFIKPMRDLLPLPTSWEHDTEEMKNYMKMAEEWIESHTNTEKPMPA